MIKNKRQNALIMALLLFTFSIFPQKPVQAVVPIVVGLAVQALGAGGTVVASDLLISGGSALIGGVIVALAITPNNADAPVRVPLMSDKPTIDAAIPPPFAPATQSETTSVKYYGPGGYIYSSAQQPCEMSITDPAYAGYSCSCTGSSCSIYVNGVYSYSYTAVSGTVTSCPDGYTSNGTNCSLTASPRSVVSDSKHDVELDSTGYTSPATEKDRIPQYAQNNNKKMTFYGTDSKGQRVAMDVELAADGTTVIKKSAEYVVGGQTVVKQEQTRVNTQTGQVISSQAVSAPGVIEAPTAVGVSPVVSTTGAQVSPVSVDFPSDYARSGEAATAATNIKASVDPIKDSLTASSDVVDPALPAWADSWGSTFNAVKGWSMPGHTSTCPVGSFEWNSSVYAIDSHCTLVSNYWGALQGAMTVVWSILALFVVLGA